MNRSNVIVVSLPGLSLLVGAVEFRLNSIGEYMTEQTQTVWSLVFVILTVMWAIDDSKRQSFDAPFDFGLLMYIFWPIAFPWYLLSTRRFEGIIYTAGFLALWIGPWLAGLVAYVYLYSE